SRGFHGQVIGPAAPPVVGAHHCPHHTGTLHRHDEERAVPPSLCGDLGAQVQPRAVDARPPPQGQHPLLVSLPIAAHPHHSLIPLARRRIALLWAGSTVDTVEYRVAGTRVPPRHGG